MKAQFIDFIVVEGSDCPIGANQLAHPATDAGVGRLGTLTDTMIDTKDVGRFFLQSDRYIDSPLPVNPQFNRPYRTYRRTTAAEGAFFFAPADLPRQILGA